MLLGWNAAGLSSHLDDLVTRSSEVDHHLTKDQH
jgi:hypothetical protein